MNGFDAKCIRANKKVIGFYKTIECRAAYKKAEALKKAEVAVASKQPGEALSELTNFEYAPRMASPKASAISPTKPKSVAPTKIQIKTENVVGKAVLKTEKMAIMSKAELEDKPIKMEKQVIKAARSQSSDVASPRAGVLPPSSAERMHRNKEAAVKKQQASRKALQLKPSEHAAKPAATSSPRLPMQMMAVGGSSLSKSTKQRSISPSLQQQPLPHTSEERVQQKKAAALRRRQAAKAKEVHGTSYAQHGSASAKAHSKDWDYEMMLKLDDSHADPPHLWDIDFPATQDDPQQKHLVDCREERAKLDQEKANAEVMAAVDAWEDAVSPVKDVPTTSKMLSPAIQQSIEQKKQQALLRKLQRVRATRI